MAYSVGGIFRNSEKFLYQPSAVKFPVNATLAEIKEKKSCMMFWEPTVKAGMMVLNGET